MAGGVQRRDLDVFADREVGAMRWGPCHGFAVFAAYDGDLGGEGIEDLGVAAGVVPVVVGVDYGGEVEGFGLLL